MKKKIGLWAALALVVGNILGVGIFTTTGYLATYLSDPIHIMMAWVIGAVYAISGGLVYGYLAREMPQQGGDYVYLKKYFHPYFSYLFGWSGLFITYTGSIAALSIGAAHYLNDIIPTVELSGSFFSFDVIGVNWALDGIKISGFFLIVFFTGINHFGIRAGGKTQVGLTLSIMITMLIFIICGYFSGADQLIQNSIPGRSISFGPFLTSLAAVLFTYMGWTTVVYIANEVKDPERNIPSALFIGVLIVVVLYMGINFIFLSSMPTSQLADTINVASRVAGQLWGGDTPRIIAGMVLIAILSSLNSTVLSGPRIYQAMAADGYLFNGLKMEHKRYGTPHIALWVQGSWAIVLLMSGTFNQLLSIVVAAILLFSIFTGTVALKMLYYNLGAKKHALSLVWISTIVYLLLCFLILFNILINQFIESVIGFFILLLSLPFYLLQSSKTGNKINKMRV